MRHLRELLSRPRLVRHAEKRRSRLLGEPGTRFVLGNSQRGRSEAAARSHRIAEIERGVCQNVLEAGERKWIWESGGRLESHFRCRLRRRYGVWRWKSGAGFATTGCRAKHEP